MKWYDVTFIGDFFSLHTVVILDEEFNQDQAVSHAAQHIKEHYGWDVLDAANIEVEAVAR